MLMHDQAKLNTHFSHTLFASLDALGVETIFIAPGSRSSPLSLASCHYAKKVFVHFDERSLGFMALGAAKASLKPQAIIVTSGTAVANLLPACMEAYNSKLPLIFITADRPFDLHDTGSNQTISQEHVFSNYVKMELNFDAPTAAFNEKAISSKLAQAVYLSKKGPIHINIPLHEPLFDRTVDYPHDVEIRQDIKSLGPIKIEAQKGLIILGSDAVSSFEDAFKIFQLSEKLHLPIIADITSNYRSFGLEHLHYYPFLLEEKILESDLIIHFGKKLTSKSLENYIKAFNGTYIHVNSDEDLYDPYHKINFTLRATLDEAIDKLSVLKEHDIERKIDLYLLKHGFKDKIESFIEDYPSYEEAMYVHVLQKYLQKETNLFIGSSLPIRHFESFFFPEEQNVKIYTQRGVSGIDGLIASACGIAQSKGLTFGLFGDLSSLYDLNALSLITKYQIPLIPIIFNNHGGGIFSYLPIAQATDRFEEIIATTHQFDFKAFAQGFDLDYLQVSSLEEFEAFLENPTLFTLVEIVSSKEGNPLFLEAVKNHLCSFVKQRLSPLIPQSSSTECSALTMTD
jgi:2-succinyl-5-enolpyruvyl-6-hydroxy-3-cyclohexene-1-carboxylate synthase